MFCCSNPCEDSFLSLPSSSPLGSLDQAMMILPELDFCSLWAQDLTQYGPEFLVVKGTVSHKFFSVLIVCEDSGEGGAKGSVGGVFFMVLSTNMPEPQSQTSAGAVSAGGSVALTLTWAR